MSLSIKTLNTRSVITGQLLRSLGYSCPAMQLAGIEIAKSLRSNEQEFTLRPRVLSDVHLLKFRTVFTNHEVIVRFSQRKSSMIIFTFIEHLDRFQCEGTTRFKVRDIQFDLGTPNMARKLTQIIHYEVLPWLKLGADNLRKPSIRLPVKRESINTKSRFLPASFIIDHFAVSASGSDADLVLFSKNKALTYNIPMQPGLLARLQDARSMMHLVIFANGNHYLVDETSFLREFIYIDQIDVSKPEITAQQTRPVTH